MKRSRAPSALAGSSQVVTTTTKKVKIPARVPRPFGAPAWAGKTKTGFPKELKITHRYTDRLTLTGTAGASISQVYSCNGMYDPDITSTGHQPYYFDQLAAIYNHYTVLASKITVRLVPGSGNTVGSVFTMYINDDASVTYSNADSAAENQTAVWKMLGSGGTSEVVVSKKWRAQDAFGPGVISDPNLQGTTGANPTEQQTFTIRYNSVDGASTVSCAAIVCVEYQAIWQELKDVAAS